MKLDLLSRTRKLETFISPALNRRSLWLVLPVLLLFLFHPAWLFFEDLSHGFGSEAGGGPTDDDPAKDEDIRRLEIMLELTWHGVEITMLWVLLRWLHKRRLRTLFGASARRIARDFACGFLAALLVLALFEFYLSAVRGALELRDTDLWRWLGYALLIIPFVALQTLYEELVFRGYLLQQFAARFRHWALWLLVPSVLFGLWHYPAGGQPDEIIARIFITGFTGFVLALVTVQTGNIGAAWGAHFAWNYSVWFIVGYQSRTVSFSLFDGLTSGEGLFPYDWIVAEVIATLAIGFAALWVFTRRGRNAG